MRTTPFLRNISTPRLSTPNAALRERVRRPAYFNKLTTAEDLAPLFKVSDILRK
jgi:acetyl-CoA hydrolase